MISSLLSLISNRWIPLNLLLMTHSLFIRLLALRVWEIGTPILVIPIDSVAIALTTVDIALLSVIVVVSRGILPLTALTNTIMWMLIKLKLILTRMTLMVVWCDFCLTRGIAVSVLLFLFQ